MTLVAKPRRIEFMVVRDTMHEAKRWVEARLGLGEISADGKSVAIYDANRPPYTYGESVKATWAYASKGSYILHNGCGEFRVLTKDQFEYWYEEEK